MNKKLIILAVSSTIFIIMGGINSIPLYGTQYLSSNSPGFSYSISPWWDDNWSNRKPITINCSQVDNDLINFPILVSITDTDLKNDSQNDGDDITFIQYLGNIIQLDHEIELYSSATSHLVAWVNIASLSSTRNTTIYMYYNNSNCDSQENPAGVWDSNYKAVWHMNDATISSITDSTSNNNHGIKKGANEPNEISGKIGKCQNFGDDDDYINCSDDSSLDLTLTGTVEAWINTTRSDWSIIVSKSNFSNGTDGWTLCLNANDTIQGTVADATGFDAIYRSSANDGNWHYAVFRWNSTNLSIFKNGSQIGNPVDHNRIANPNSKNCFIGDNHDFHDGGFNGAIDEIRISNIIRSASWINTTCNAIKNTDTFVRVGSNDTQP